MKKLFKAELWFAACFCAMSISAQAAGSVVTIDQDRVMHINGSKVFPIGLSPGPPLNSVTPWGKDSMQELKDAGALLHRMNQSQNWNAQLIADYEAVLDWAEQHGMYIWLNLREVSKFAAGDSVTEASLRDKVLRFKDHPALGVWKNYDEAWWGGVSAADLKRGYDVIKELDQNHPVVQTHAPRGTVEDLQPYNAATDALALDIYPVGYPPGANSLWANKEISMVGDYTQFLDEVGQGQKHLWLIEQIAWSGVTNPGKTLRFPTFTQSRYMAYQAIVNGARGIMFFGGNNSIAMNNRDDTYGWNWTFWETVLRRLVLELGSHGMLADALVAPDSALPIVLGGTTWPDIEFCVREVPPYLYIIACKREGATIQATFGGLPAGVSLGEVLYESPRSITVTNGTFTDWFGPFEVHAYRFLVTNQAAEVSIETQPASRTNAIGTTASFNVGVTGLNPQFQWRKNGLVMTNAGSVSGVYTPTLTIASVTLSDEAAYTVLVTNSFSSVTSSPAVLTVSDSLYFVEQPSSRTNNAGSTAHFAGRAQALAGGGITYQWLRNGVAMSDSSRISGATSASLTIAGLTSADSTTYRLVATSGGQSVTSAVAVLTVIYPRPFYEPFDYPAASNLGGQETPNFLQWHDVGTSTAGPYVQTVNGSLALSGLAGSLGNSAQFGGLGKSARLSFPSGQAVSSGTLYYSMLFKVADLSGTSASGKFVAGFNNSPGTQTSQPTVIGTRLYVRSAGSGYNLGMTKNSSTSTDWVWDARTFAVNQVVFIVGSYTFSTSGGSDTSMMWIDPAPATFGLGSPPATTLTATAGNNLSIASFVLFQRDATEPAAMVVDELRIAESWAEVTPTAAASGPILLQNASLGAGGLVQFQFSNNTGRTLSVHASTNFVNWINLGSAFRTAPGLYEFSDWVVSETPQKFYRLQSP